MGSFRIEVKNDKDVTFLINKGFKLTCAKCGSTWLGGWVQQEFNGYECQDCGHSETINHIYTNNPKKGIENL
tara:strand:- start:219 stop:434 length:216 start_codon:yes stop_codon:yes gene_type:complete